MKVGRWRRWWLLLRSAMRKFIASNCHAWAKGAGLEVIIFSASYTHARAAAALLSWMRRPPRAPSLASAINIHASHLAHALLCCVTSNKDKHSLCWGQLYVCFLSPSPYTALIECLAKKFIFRARLQKLTSLERAREREVRYSTAMQIQTFSGFEEISIQQAKLV
jgi:hypothetical protein